MVLNASVGRNAMKELSGKLIEVLPPNSQTDVGTIIPSLRSLREMASLTIEQMARRLNVQPETVVGLELEADMPLEHLWKYAHALGAKVKVFEREMQMSEGPPVYCMRTAILDRTFTRHQLVLPIFDDQVIPEQREIVLSIHPKYCSKILAGEKTVELRRRFPVSGILASTAYIYSTSPVKAMVGRVKIVDVFKLPILEIWQVYGTDACIEKGDFDSYFSGLTLGTVLKIRNPERLSRNFELLELKQRFGFKPPQSFIYAKEDLIGALDRE